MAEPGFLNIASAQNWFVMHKLRDGSVTIEPLACWALLASPSGAVLEGIVAQGNTLHPVSMVYPDGFEYVWPEGWNIDKDGIRRLPDSRPVRPGA